MTTWLALWLAMACQSMGTNAENRAALANLEKAVICDDFAALDAAIAAIKSGGVRQAAVGSLRGKLQCREPTIRRRAAYALSQIDPGEATKSIPELVEPLQDRAPQLRARVALALAHMGSAAREAIPALTEMLDDRNPRARAGAARALGSMGVEAAATIPKLIELLKDVNPPVRALAALALGLLGPGAKAASAPLNRVASMDEDAEVRAAAGAALEEVAPRLRTLIDALGASEAQRRLWAVSVLIDKGPEGKDALADLVEVVKKDAVASVRAGAALALGKMGGAARRADSD
jgi:HEAT repeat protein